MTAAQCSCRLRLLLNDSNMLGNVVASRAIAQILLFLIKANLNIIRFL